MDITYIRTHTLEKITTTTTKTDVYKDDALETFIYLFVASLHYSISIHHVAPVIII